MIHLSELNERIDAQAAPKPVFFLVFCDVLHGDRGMLASEQLESLKSSTTMPGPALAFISAHSTAPRGS